MERLQEPEHQLVCWEVVCPRNDTETTLSLRLEQHHTISTLAQKREMSQSPTPRQRATGNS